MGADEQLLVSSRLSAGAQPFAAPLIDGPAPLGRCQVHPNQKGSGARVGRLTRVLRLLELCTVPLYPLYDNRRLTTKSGRSKVGSAVQQPPNHTTATHT